MNTFAGWFGAAALMAGAGAASLHHKRAERPRALAASPCAADSNYQRLAFWVGDWEVFDSTGAPYAIQRVHAVIDACAITVEWTGRVGDRGMGISAFDGKTGEWKQFYASNQVPGPLGVQLRKSDPTYAGAGVRFIPLVGPADGVSTARITIAPVSAQRVMQTFEESRDGGKTWRVVFKAEHRLLGAGGS